MSEQNHNRYRRKLTEEDVLNIVERCRKGETQKVVADGLPCQPSDGGADNVRPKLE